MNKTFANRFVCALIDLILKGREAPWKILYILYRLKYSLPTFVKFNGPGIVITGSGVMECSGPVYFSYYSRIFIDEGTSIKIGNGVSLGHYLRIYTSDVRAKSFILKDKDADKKIKRNISIGSNVLIGPNVFINKGTIIGDNTIVVANSVLSGVYVGNSIVSGNPAKVVKSYVNI